MKRISKYFHYLLLLVLLFLLGCKPSWTETIRFGEIENTSFYETIPIEHQNGIIIIPVEIDGTTYRFLFDSGAPLSISNELQEKFQFKTVSTGHIVDSDQNRKKVKYVEVDTLFVGKIPFYNQTAFVSNLKANPLLACMKLDGILGSNLMRYCNWTINYADKKVALFNFGSTPKSTNAIEVPFTTDKQFNILMDMKIGDLSIPNMKIDYGSNGSIKIPESIFNQLAFEKIYTAEGVKQSGLIGEHVSFKSSIGVAGILSFGDAEFKNIEIITGAKKLVGKDVLSKYEVTIDWDKKMLYFRDINVAKEIPKQFGLMIGFDQEIGLFIQSVTQPSIAFSKGLQPNMQILKVNNLNFKTDNNFCDFALLMSNSPDTLIIEALDNTGKVFSVELPKTNL